MCGICGIIGEYGHYLHVGKILVDMACSQQIRATDSAGFAVFDSSNGTDSYNVKIAQRFIEKDADGKGRDKYYIEDRAVDGGIEDILTSLIADQYLISYYKDMNLVKDLGLAAAVAEKYHVRELRGTHGVGHLRIGTSSRVNLINAHPFSTSSMPDLAIVHNGEISNKEKIKMLLENKGHNFHSDCDSEVIAVFLADQFRAYGDFERANHEAIKIFDGPFTYIAATKDAIAIVRDKNGLRKAIVGYSPETNEMPGFIAIATDNSALNQIGANNYVHTPRPGKPEFFYKGEDFSKRFKHTN